MKDFVVKSQLVEIVSKYVNYFLTISYYASVFRERSINILEKLEIFDILSRFNHFIFSTYVGCLKDCSSRKPILSIFLELKVGKLGNDVYVWLESSLGREGVQNSILDTYNFRISYAIIDNELFGFFDIPISKILIYENSLKNVDLNVKYVYELVDNVKFNKDYSAFEFLDVSIEDLVNLFRNDFDKFMRIFDICRLFKNIYGSIEIDDKEFENNLANIKQLLKPVVKKFEVKEGNNVIEIDVEVECNKDVFENLTPTEVIMDFLTSRKVKTQNFEQRKTTEYLAFDVGFSISVTYSHYVNLLRIIISNVESFLTWSMMFFQRHNIMKNVVKYVMKIVKTIEIMNELIK